MQIALYEKLRNWERIRVVYNPITGHIGINSKYVDAKKTILKNSVYNKTEAGKLAMKKADRKYFLTKKGKITSKKHAAKRERDLGWISMFPNPFADSVLVDYHHITDTYVVAIPRELHKLYLGKYHREKVMDIVKQIYF